MKISYHAAAEAEVVAAAVFYEQRVPGLGREFLEEYDRCIAAIVAQPGAHRIIRGDKRRCLMKRFPYGIYFRWLSDEIRILVLKHHSRHPDAGMARA